MPDGDDVLRAVGSEVGAEPQLLRGAHVTAAGHQLALAVEIHDVPIAAGNVVAVVAVPVCVGCSAAEVRVVTVEVVGSGLVRSPVVVAGGRARSGLDGATPCRLVAVGVVRERGALRVHVVARGPDGAHDAADDRRRRRVLGASAVGDVAGAHQDRIRAWGRGERPGRAGGCLPGICDGDEPFEGLARADRVPCRAGGGGRHVGVLGDLCEGAAGERPAEEGDGEGVAIRIGDADIQCR